MLRHFQGGAVGHPGDGAGGGNLLGVRRHDARDVGPDLERIGPEGGGVQRGAVVRAAAAQRADPSGGVAADKARRHDDCGIRGGDGRPDPPVRLRQVVLHDELAGIDPMGMDAFTFEFPGQDAGGKELAEGDFLLRRGGFHLGEQAHHLRGGLRLVDAREQAPHDGQVPVHQHGLALPVPVRAREQPVRTAADSSTRDIAVASATEDPPNFKTRKPITFQSSFQSYEFFMKNPPAQKVYRLLDAASARKGECQRSFAWTAEGDGKRLYRLGVGEGDGVEVERNGMADPGKVAYIGLQGVGLDTIEGLAIEADGILVLIDFRPEGRQGMQEVFQSDWFPEQDQEAAVGQRIENHPLIDLERHIFHSCVEEENEGLSVGNQGFGQQFPGFLKLLFVFAGFFLFLLFISEKLVG